MNIGYPDQLDNHSVDPKLIREVENMSRDIPLIPSNLTSPPITVQLPRQRFMSAVDDLVYGFISVLANKFSLSEYDLKLEYQSFLNGNNLMKLTDENDLLNEESKRREESDLKEYQDD